MIQDSNQLRLSGPLGHKGWQCCPVVLSLLDCDYSVVVNQSNGSLVKAQFLSLSTVTIQAGQFPAVRSPYAWEDFSDILGLYTLYASSATLQL